MKKKELKISEYLKSYYHLDKNEEYETEITDARNLLIDRRFDLGAKLYYIQCRQRAQGMRLALSVYDAHIQAFQDGIVEETGNRKKRGLDCYHRVFDKLIESFAKEEYDIDREWIPVDKSGQILDGAHRVACAVYFGKHVKVVRLPQVEGDKFDYRFFLYRGMERGYAQIMAAVFAKYKQNTAAFVTGRSGKAVMKRICAKFGSEEPKVHLIYAEKRKREGKKQYVWVFCSLLSARKIAELAGGRLVQAETVLGLQEKETAQQIKVTHMQKFCLAAIRRLRYVYTSMILLIKRILRIPV